MLTAKNSKDEEIISFRLPWPIDYTQKYHCKECNEEVIYVDSNKKIKHFRHYKKSHCTIEKGITEKESEEHLALKKAIYEILERQGYHPKLEQWLSDKSAKPDITFELGVIECQVSNISKRKFYSRTKNYSNKNIAVLWITNKKNYDLGKLFQSIYFGKFYHYANNYIFANRIIESELYLDKLVYAKDFMRWKLFYTWSDNKKWGKFKILLTAEKRFW